MKLIKKNNKELIRDISNYERTLLLKHQQTSKLTVIEISQLTQFYNDCRDKQRWILCDCLPDGKPVFMTITKRDSGSIFLTRMQEHALDCPFYAESFVNTSEPTSITSKIKKGDILKLHTKVRLNDKRKNEKLAADENQYKRTPKLARLLYTLIGDARLNTLGEKVELPQQYQRLITAASAYRVSASVFLDEVLVTHPKAIFALYKILREKKSLFKPLNKPYGVGIVLADKIEENTLVCCIKQETFLINLEGRLQFISGRVGEESSPFMVILTITDTAQKPGFYVPMQGYAIPVLSKSALIPVDSRYERKVLHALMQWLPWWKQYQLNVRLEKPLFDEEVIINGEPHFIRPDILIKSSKVPCILEVGGSHEPEYLARKERTHTLMQLKCPVFNFDALKAEQEKNFEAQLTQLIKRISPFLFREKAHVD